MSGVAPQLALVGVLVLLNALFAGSELALVSLREGQLRRLQAESASGRALAALARDPNRFLATIQIGITLAGFLASASAAVSLAEPLEGSLDAFGGAARPLSIVGVTVVLSYFTLVLGELAPKRLAMQRAEGWGLLVARPLALVSRAAAPAVWLLSRSTDLVVRVLGGDPTREREQVTREELRELVAVQHEFSPQQRRIIDGAFEISERSLHEVVRPRPDVFSLDADQTCSSALSDLAASGHSRAPVCEGRVLDETIGVVHLRDLLDQGRVAVREVVRPMGAMPETAGVLHTLRRMQNDHLQMVIVVNEHGGAEGIVTVEDLVEELVGEIYDETDRDVLAVRRGAQGAFVVPGRFPCHDLVDLGVTVPPGDYATVAGFLLDRLQRIPSDPGDEVVEGAWRFTVTAVDDFAISEVEIEAAGSERSAPGET